MASDYDGPEFYSERWSTARKEHRCGECYRTIGKGERYFTASGKWEGEFRTNRMCIHCNRFAAAWLMEHCHGYLFGGVKEDIREHLSAGAYYSTKEWMEISRLVVNMRRKWRTRKGELVRLPA